MDGWMDGLIMIPKDGHTGESFVVATNFVKNLIISQLLLGIEQPSHNTCLIYIHVLLQFVVFYSSVLGTPHSVPQSDSI